MAKDLKLAQEEMIKANREAAWKEMAKQVAHEIKNPLTPIKLSIQHLRQAYRDNVDGFENILKQVTKTILEQIETLSHIASEFSFFARMPARKLEIVNVHENILEVINLFQHNNKVTFEKELYATEFIIKADEEELKRSFVNVIRNAIQAMNEQGKIVISTSSDNGFIYIKINDTGPGIPIEIRDKIFEPNFSTKTDGMGLGLAIVKKTIGDLGGNIVIVSEVGRGTTVKISLLLLKNTQQEL